MDFSSNEKNIGNTGIEDKGILGVDLLQDISAEMVVIRCLSQFSTINFQQITIQLYTFNKRLLFLKYCLKCWGYNLKQIDNPHFLELLYD